MEEEAYKVGNLCFRDWEDNVKSGKIRISIPLKESLIREENTRHTVVEGDTLFEIAAQYYQDGHKWPLIYIKNKSIIGETPDLIKIGQVFEIPDVSEWDTLSDSDVKNIYSLSNYYKDIDGKMTAIQPEKFVTDPEIFTSFGDPAKNAIEEHRIWAGKKETDSQVQGRLAAMWANIGWRSWSNKIPWSAAAISWFFRGVGGFKKGAGHGVYVKDAKKRKKDKLSGYQHFTPEELNYSYQRNDIIGYIPRSYGKVHCDIYIGNDECIGGNLSNTIIKNKVVDNKVSGEEIILVLRSVSVRPETIQEWKNEELNKLLLEKFNLGVIK
jgi:LysM repeat protein